ncbi:MAG: VOC family protein [Candidatus Methylomirabilales bacterium]
MIKRLTHVTIMVRDQDEALDWYTRKLGFKKVHDERGTIPGLRWPTIAPAGQESPEIVLLKAQDGDAVGRGAMWVLEADDCRKTYEELRARGVTFRSAPEDAPWGVSAVFEDLYGNQFNLVEPRAR